MFFLALFMLDSDAVPIPGWSMVTKSLLRPAVKIFTKIFRQGGATIAGKVSSAGAAKGAIALRTAASANGNALAKTADFVKGTTGAMKGVPSLTPVTSSLKAIGDVSRPARVMPAQPPSGGFSLMDGLFLGAPLVQSFITPKDGDNGKPRPGGGPGRFSK